MNKVVRIQLVPVETEQLTFSDIYKILWDLQRETMQTANRTIQLCWEFSGFESDYKKKFNEYPNGEAREEALGYKALNSYIYSVVSKEFKKLNTSNLSTTATNTFNKFKGDKLKLLKGEISIPNYKNTIPIDLHNKAIALHHDEKSGIWLAELSLLSTVYRKELELNSGRIKFKMYVKSKSQKAILERCLDEEYKVCASKLLYKNGKWFLNLTYGFDHETVKMKYRDDLIMGVYLGEYNAVYCTFNKIDNFLKLEGGEVEAFRNQVEARRKSLLKQSISCGDGRKGHGYHTRVKPIETIGNKISNFRNTINHRYSRLIVDFAKENNCGMIYFEDLKGISEENKFLKNWSYFDLQSKIVYKAKQEGIETHSIKLKPPEELKSQENADKNIARLLAGYIEN